MKPGDILQDRYRIERLLAQGVHSEVYLATHLDLETKLVVKLLSSGDERLLREGRILSKLRCPHTVRVIDFGRTDDGCPFLLLEYVDGRPLRKLLDEGELDRGRVIRITTQILKSLEEAHAAGLIHGELTPAHVMVGPGDHTTVIEFGGATDGGSAQRDLTATALILRAMLTSADIEASAPLDEWLDRIFGHEATPFSSAGEARDALAELSRASAPRRDQLVDTVIGGRYEVLELLERRPEGQVYRVALIGTPARGALLRTRTDLPRDAETQSKFRAIIRAASQLRHPNIARTLDYGYLDDGTPYYVDELPSGGTLFRHLRDGPLPESRTVAILRDCIEGLHYASRLGWEHRALSPDTVELPERPAAVTARLTSFALHRLRRLVDHEPPDIRVAAPETLRGEERTLASDIYSLGHVGAACALGHLPADHGDSASLHLDDTPWELHGTAEASTELRAIIEKCMSKRVDDRFASAADLLAALEALSTHEVVPVALPRPGAVLDGRYELESVLGSGGFARVFRAHDRRGDSTVAVKVLHAHLTSEDDRRRFEREGEILFTHLENRHTVRVLDYGVSRGGHYFITTEFLEGETLDHLLAERGRMRPQLVVLILLQVLSSLGEAHDRQIFHRDIKPQNIMISPRPYRSSSGEEENCWVTVLDFGIASLQGELHDSTSLTLTGTACGTARYMAPEQMFGHVVGPETDIYSLGLIAYELLTGEKAIKGTSNGEIVTNQVSPQSAILPAGVGVPVDLRMVVNKMIRKDRETRFRTVRDVHEALSEVKF